MLLGALRGVFASPMRPEEPCLRKTAFVSKVASLVCLAALATVGRAQERGGLGGVQSYGFSTTWSPDSSHILIGASEQRRVWTLGAEYTYLLYRGRYFRYDYEGQVLPLYEETDPLLTGTTFTLSGQSIVTPQTPVRVVYVAKGAVSSLVIGSNPGIPIYPVYFRQDTYGASISPLGVRVSAFPRWRVQPSFSLDLGFVVSARDIPIDQGDQFNYLFSFGPGLQVYRSEKASWRLEYLYRHMSNAGQGAQNPGVDQGVVRVTLSLHR
jgi:Lipid A 3-O-deacylase (PagL)